MHTEIDTEPEAPEGLELAIAIPLEHARAAAFVVDDGADPDAPIPYALTPAAEAEGATRRASERLVRAAARLEAGARLAADGHRYRVDPAHPRRLLPGRVER
jgi:hypothetical protein